MPQPQTKTVHWSDHKGRQVTREIRLTINVEDFRGMAGYPWLVLAANPQLSAEDISEWLFRVAEGHPGAFRPPHWLQRRRKMFRPAYTLDMPGRKRNPDGQDERAFKIMAAHPTHSLRNLVALLRERGIVRSREWVRLWRVALLTTNMHIKERE